MLGLLGRIHTRKVRGWMVKPTSECITNLMLTELPNQIHVFNMFRVTGIGLNPKPSFNTPELMIWTKRPNGSFPNSISF